MSFQMTGFGFGIPPPQRGLVPPNLSNGPPPLMGMNRPMGARPNLPPTQNKGKLVPQDIPKEDEKEKPPVTTVFVGSITERAPDTMIRTLLQRCGNIVSWKRVQGADGKLQAFGFCEFEQPEATLRCIRLLNDWQIADKKLVVKVDDKTKALLDEYEKGHVIDEESAKREDRLAQAALEAVMREFAAELRRTLPAPTQERQSTRDNHLKMMAQGPMKDQGLDDMDVAQDTKNLINREIERFREAYKDDEGPSEKKERTDRDRERRRQIDKELEAKKRSMEKAERRDTGEKVTERDDRDRASDKGREKSSDRGDKQDKDRNERGPDRGSDRDRNDRSGDKDRSRSKRTRSRSPHEVRKERSKSPQNRPVKLRDPEEDAEERYERLRMERQLRDKEMAYQERLKNWEVRERKKIREDERERQRSEERKLEEKKEARRLREFLEDYDDERDDSKYYRSGALSRRMKEREKEAEADMRDKQREKEEMDALRKKLEEEGHPDPDAEISRQQQQQQNGLQQHEPEPVTVVEKSQSIVTVVESEPDRFRPALRPVSESSQDVPDTSFMSQSNDDSRQSFPIIKFSANASISDVESPAAVIAPKRKKLTVTEVFGEDTTTEEVRKKRPLVPLDYDEDKKRAAKTLEDKRAAIKRLIEKIPTDKDELFAWPMDWEQVDSTLLDNRVRPWVNKKIMEYIGEEEPTLTDFICQKVMGHSTAPTILADVAMVLDEEAEVFVVKMWRLLVYETEAKKAGLVK